MFFVGFEGLEFGAALEFLPERPVDAPRSDVTFSPQLFTALHFPTWADRIWREPHMRGVPALRILGENRT
jgi:hypothetical protein